MDAKQLQVALACLGAGAPDGIMGEKTESAIELFQTRIMKTVPTRTLDHNTIAALQHVRTLWPTMDQVKCKCGHCSGFGNGLHLGEYRVNKPNTEAYYQYEYPGISEMILWSHAMLVAAFPTYEWDVSSGYRCHNDNAQHHRSSTNHMGKALDSYVVIPDRTLRQTVCYAIRQEMHTLGAMNIGWDKRNRVSFEPASLAPTWIHNDVRAFDRKWIDATLIKEWK